MDKNNEVTQEELQAEQAALSEVKEDEVRAAVIEEYGFDQDEDAERIEKAVQKELNHRKSLSQAIGQKIKHRTEAEKLRTTVKPSEKQVNAEDFDKQLDEKLTERLEQRDLDSLTYPEDLKKEIQKVAKAQGISIKAASQDPYIQFKIDAFEKEKKAEDASLSRSNKSGGKKTYTFDAPPDVDMSTKEGRDEYDQWVEAMKKQGH